MRNTEGGNMRINDFQNIIEVIKQDVLQSEELASIFKNDNETEQETYRMPVTLPKTYYKPLYISHCR